MIEIWESNEEMQNTQQHPHTTLVANTKQGGGEDLNPGAKSLKSHLHDITAMLNNNYQIDFFTVNVPVDALELVCVGLCVRKT